MGLKVITPPAALFTLATLRLWCKLDPVADVHPDDDLITGIILPAAHAYAEQVNNRAYGEQTLELALDEFPGTTAIALPRSPATSITSVTYVDAAGATQTLAIDQYALDTYSDPSCLVPAYDVEWPDTLDTINAVKVRYVAGAATVPAGVKQAMAWLVGNAYENRNSAQPGSWTELPIGVEAMLATDRSYANV
jgi:uncharacterized phiE125 gp8 family phage protein